ncbi:MAG: phosphoribosylanthranilate isomerase [Dinoroseobacter sp.]|jgi:phosphoribosylanthranilate isomerase
MFGVSTSRGIVLSEYRVSTAVLNKRIKVKVCGMTRPEEACAAIDLGVDAIGMILYAKSPRLIGLKAAQAIRQEVPAFISLVGVFVDADASFINHYISEVGLDLVQLHGAESNQFGCALEAPFIKAIRAKSRQQVELDTTLFPDAMALLVDPYVEGQHGGTGQILKPALWPTSVSQKLILAGGLSSQNIAKACELTSPFAVDLNSGVESEPGRKESSKIAAVLCALGR